VAAVRVLTVWCPDWPVVALGPAADAVAVLTAGQVVACSPAARAAGVRQGLRRREAQSRCPELRLLDRDEAAEARAFEPVLAALEGVCPRIDAVRPGLCAMVTKGAARYFGGDEALVTVTAGAVADVLAHPHAGTGYGARIGIADGLFAATRAARREVIVPPGGSAAFLAPYPVATVGHPELADLLVRLGIRTLGELAALPATAVMSRFGWDGARAHRLACGRDERPPRSRVPAPELVVEHELDPPAEQVEQVAFVGRALAEQLRELLAERGFACTRVLVEAETEHGEQLARFWRHDGAFTSTALTQRIRWQLGGWLSGTAADRPTAGITLLRLVADEVHRDPGRQLGLWDETADEVTDEKVSRVLARVQGLFGVDAVLVATPSGGRGGGRGPAEQVRLTPWGEPVPPAEPDCPWPGRVPAPAPATVHVVPPAVRVLGSDGQPVSVDERGCVSNPPAQLATSPGRAVQITAWAGPWPVSERWWERGARSFARFQLLAADGVARLVAVDAAGQGWLEAVYD
jgi:protein ImuB